MKRRKINSSFLMLGGFLLALVLGLIGNKYFPEQCLSFSTSILSPIVKAFFRSISFIATPLIFLMVITSIVNYLSAKKFYKVNKRLVRHTLVSLVILTICTLIISISLFGISGSNALSSDGSLFTNLLNTILDAIPTSVVAMFSGDNPLQAVIVALLLGIVLLKTSQKKKELVQISSQLSNVLLELMILINNLMPIFVSLSVLKLIFSGDIANLSGAWQLIVIFLAGTALQYILQIVKVAIFRRDMKIVDFIKILVPSFVIALTTTSSIAAFPISVETLKKDLKVDEKYVDYSLPLMRVIYKPGTLVNYIAIACYSAYVLGGGMMSIDWYVMLGFVALILSFAIPPVSGGFSTCIVLLFTQMGIYSEEGIALALAVGAAYDFLRTASNVVGVESEIFSSAEVYK